nr:hypothetical protein TetV2_00607 [Oceanusvirus sp.]
MLLGLFVSMFCVGLTKGASETFCFDMDVAVVRAYTKTN